MLQRRHTAGRPLPLPLLSAVTAGFFLSLLFGGLSAVAAAADSQASRLPLVPYPSKVSATSLEKKDWAPFAKEVHLQATGALREDSFEVQSLRDYLSKTVSVQESGSSFIVLRSSSRLVRRHRESSDIEESLEPVFADSSSSSSSANLKTPIASIVLDVSRAGTVLAEEEDTSGAGVVAGAVDESYTLEVKNGEVKIAAKSAAGAYYGTQTLKQLISFAGGTAVPEVTIEDAPRFKWRGLMLDTSRHFFTAENVKSMLETMAAFKLNHFHWHLTDDQGWRLPIQGYPSLTDLGSHGVNDGAYTQEQIKDVVDFAKQRHIEVVPEVDVPGHVQAAVAAYPELGNTDIQGWHKPDGPSKEWGVHDYTLAPSEKVLSFLGSVFDSMNSFFPGHYVHIGGDEVKTNEWRHSPKAAASASQLGETAGMLQEFFNNKVAALLKTKGKHVLAWDESQHIGGLPSDTTIMAWRSVNEAKIAARHGHNVVNADNAVYYLDHYQGPEATEPKAICCHSSLSQVWNYDPMPSGLTQQEEQRVIGGQGQLWSEFFPTWKHVEYMAWPRSIALAERLWSASSSLSGYHDFHQRLQARLPDLDARGVNYRHLDGH
mmetsp:Transcript_78395/g.162868  ORF Transcript_78395/g.162868 Transcript_78395/m.162868 type:complete len:601 (-) Transcript_78395:72-1874(-)